MTLPQEPPLDLLVHRMTWEAEEVLSVELTHPEGKPLPAWEPGAHLDLHTGGQIRQYSLCGDPADTGRYRIAVLHEPSSRGGSRHVHTVLRPGATVTVKGPRNHFALAEAPRYVFLAGGIGITPVLAQVREAAARGAGWTLWHGGRTARSMAFGAELTRLADACPTGTVHFRPQDRDGHLDIPAALDGVVPGEGTLVYCCGPEPLLAAVEEACATRGLGGQLRLERFAAVPVAAPPGGESGFEVECARSGVTVTVGPDEAVVDALERSGVQVETSCRDGICGTCETRVLGGVPDHRDMLLSTEEQAAGRTMMVCVSRCASNRLVLDL
ncbi:PDR/VanB family oxidoreductase [Streptomyces sp. DEF147AK]|uniref:PDR/VanB family oxidoreductase n=1 Tax=Streptomyces sp. DEF147AK TaxID=2759678 RepID=UPI00190AE381|nr:PDR/VanB family oxidoreductase [Streptomyces sp. DEF147AK]MBK3384805.1 oxidoreductase [Streptomyces sp. DEF147AK]